MNIFDFMYEPLRFDENKPIKLFEAFAGIGIQHMALKNLGLDIELVGISEIDKYAIQSYEAIHGKVKNFGGIGDFDRFPNNIDILTWSFPCQDISLAGKQKGMEDGTRSNYGYVFLDTVEATPYHERPKVLLMENVKALFTEKFRDDWREIQLRLERLGYTNYADVLNAKDYGVAQNRERVFIVSILGEYNYNFPKPIPLTKRLKDYLEDEVEEKYYLSDKMLAYLTDMTNRNDFVRGEKFKPHELDSEYAYTITTNTGNRPTDNFIILPETTKKGYTKTEEGDGVYINRPHQKRGVVQKGLIQTLKTSGADVGVVVKDTRNQKEKLADNLIESGTVKGGEVINHSYTNAGKNPNSRLTLEDYIETKDGIMPTLTTRADTLGVVVDNPLRIRKLTPLETWRLMGIKDEDFYKAKSSGVSDSQLYKQAGNAIVVDVLMAIFSQMIK
ncbi:MAG: DNA (cytosine-5-)-methyltransferase [Candidatus Caldatribacteriota bacterium]